MCSDHEHGRNCRLFGDLVGSDSFATAPRNRPSDLGHKERIMPRASNGDVELEYDAFGTAGDEPLLLIMGLGGQMLLWDETFCKQLAALGHHVIRFDNRDVGLSTWFDEKGVPDMAAIFAAGARGEPVEPPYTLDDMADDAMAVLDALGINSAHICGASMGGMIAQAVAIQHPGRVKSLTSIMSTTGNPNLPPPKPEAMAILASPMPEEREAVIARSVQAERVIGSPDYPMQEEQLEKRAAQLYDRAFHPSGTARQMAAIAAHGNRRPRLETLDVPALVIHGEADPLIPLESGLDTHEALAGSELMRIPGMGHNLPPGVWDKVITGISRLIRRATQTQ